MAATNMTTRIMSDLDQHRSRPARARSPPPTSLDALEAVRVEALGKQGAITALLKTLGRHDARGAPAAGPADPTACARRSPTRIAARKAALEAAALDARLATETLDMTLPVAPERRTARSTRSAR